MLEKVVNIVGKKGQKNKKNKEHLPLVHKNIHFIMGLVNALTHYSIDTHSKASTTYSFEKIVGKEEIAHKKQFLLFPRFLLNQKIVSQFGKIFDIIYLFAAELEEPKTGI